MNSKHVDIFAAIAVLAGSIAGIVFGDDEVRIILVPVATAASSFIVGAFRVKPGGADEQIKHGDFFEFEVDDADES